MYDPVNLRSQYREMEHGKAQLAGIRAAIEAADAHKDVPYQIYFRTQFCEESVFYGDDLDMVVMFPELLALVDQHPDAPATRYNSMFRNSYDHVLWVYKWLLEDCELFYQISMEDCMRFFEDYKQRCIAYGYNLRPYYEYLYSFYDSMEDLRGEEAFAMFSQLPRDENCNCKACERNLEIDYYLKRDDLMKAELLSREIENRILTCGAREKNKAWLRMKRNYLHYYLSKKDCEKIAEYCRLRERNRNGEREFECWEDFLEGYAYVDMGKALKIYKKCWKGWLEERCPADIYGNNQRICIFFRELGKARKRSSVKINFDSSFPLYRESGKYEIEELYQFYYHRAREVAEKFDARNGTDAYCRGLEGQMRNKLPQASIE